MAENAVSGHSGDGPSSQAAPRVGPAAALRRWGAARPSRVPRGVLRGAKRAHLGCGASAATKELRAMGPAEREERPVPVSRVLVPHLAVRWRSFL